MKRKRNKYDYALIAIVPIAVVVLWQAACQLGWVNASVVPSPTKVAASFVDLWKAHTFQENLLASIRRVLIGFAFGAIFGVIAGVLTGLYIKVDDAVLVIFSVLRSIPVIGLVPLLILWYGIGEKSKIIVIALATFWSVLLNTQHGISNTDKKYFEVAAMLEKDHLTYVTSVILPAALPSIFTGIRLGLSSAWKAVVAAEMIAAVRGIGYMISYARQMSQPAVMFVGLITLGVIGLALDAFVMWLQKKIIRWG